MRAAPLSCHVSRHLNKGLDSATWVSGRRISQTEGPQTGMSLVHKPLWAVEKRHNFSCLCREQGILQHKNAVMHQQRRFWSVMGHTHDMVSGDYHTV